MRPRTPHAGVCPIRNCKHGPIHELCDERAERTGSGPRYPPNAGVYRNISTGSYDGGHRRSTFPNASKR